MLQFLTNLTPEISLALGLSALLVWSSIVSISGSEGILNGSNNSIQIGNNSVRVGWIVRSLSIGLLSIILIMLIQGLTNINIEGKYLESRFEGITCDTMSQVLKLMMVVSTIGCLVVVSTSGNKVTNSTTPAAALEYPLLRLLALLGMMILVSADDLMVFYLALELQSLALYVLAASARGSAYSTEAGLKYFMLGAFASGLFLLGASLVYGYLGTTNYRIISQLLSTQIESRGLETGFRLMVTAISFKLAAAPFHMWSPDVLEGSPATSGMFFAAVTKIAALGGLIRRCYGPFYGIWMNSIGFRPFVIRSALSRTVGALASLGQRRMKRFLAYSAIGHMGFRLMGIASGTIDGLQATLTYLALYVIGSLGMWSVIVATGTRYMTDLGGLSRRRPGLAMVIAISMFSMAGVPPMGGFLAKLSVLFAAMESSMVESMYMLALFSVMISVVGAYYYLRIIKIMYFGAPNHSSELNEIDTGSAWIMSISTFITVFVLLNPTLLSILVQRATLSMIG